MKPSSSQGLASPSPLKIALRAEMKAQRRGLHEADRARASFDMGENLWSFLSNKRALCLGVFLSQPFEISLDGLIARALQAGFSVCAPRIDLHSPMMDFWLLEDLDYGVEMGTFGVRQPFPLTLAVPDILLVPGLAFDRHGGRLGSGGGWYDRFAPPLALKIGVGFEFQVVPSVPDETHDLRLDYLATEASLTPCHSSQSALSRGHLPF